MNLLQATLNQIESIDPSMVAFPDGQITKYQTIVGPADDNLKRIWGFWQNLRKTTRSGRDAGRLKATLKITELLLLETIRDMLPQPKKNEVVGIGPGGQIYRGMYNVHSSDTFNVLINNGSGFFLHEA